MSQLVPQSPLMQPVEYQGQTYYTSQYFHAQYVANSHQQAKVKYKWHQDFVRVLKAIEAYDTYVSHGDVIELRWIAKRHQGAKDPAYLQQINALEPLFRLVGFQTMYLLNATAQVALSHHLDDALSQQVSVAANTTVARQMTRKVTGALLPEEVAARKLEALRDIGRQLRTPEHIVQQEAVKMIQESTGVNLRPFLLAAPAQHQIPSDEKMLEPNDLAKEVGLPSGYRINLALEQLGWQVKKIGGGWEPTPIGMPYAALHAWTGEHSTKTGYNWKWNILAVSRELVAQGFIPPQKEA